jgi:hypothetical protein
LRTYTHSLRSLPIEEQDALARDGELGIACVADPVAVAVIVACDVRARITCVATRTLIVLIWIWRDGTVVAHISNRVGVRIRRTVACRARQLATAKT